jgi:hypothetical protein
MSPYQLFKKEKALVYLALKHEQGEIKLRKHLKPLVRNIARYYTSRYNVTEKELVNIGWTHFEFALVNYKERLKEMDIVGDSQKMYGFGLYFVWYVQQSIETYLGITNDPLIGIAQKR